MRVKANYILPSTGFFEIDNGSSVYRLIEKLTPAMTQDQLAEFYEIEKAKGNPLPMNAIQHIELFRDAMNSKNSDLLNFLQRNLRTKFPNTLTRIVYNLIGEDDEVIHNFGTSDAYSLRGEIVGRDCLIKDIEDPNVLKLLVGTKGIKTLNKTSYAINSTPMFLWRRNSKTSIKSERVLGLYAYPIGFNLYANRLLSYEYPAFLVEQVK